MKAAVIHMRKTGENEREQGMREKEIAGNEIETEKKKERERENKQQ